MDPTQEIKQEDAEKGINKTDAGLGGVHAMGKGMGACLFDGSTHIVSESIKPETLKAFITRNGEEPALELLP
jgi:hypothetical protein